MVLNKFYVDELIKRALLEDINYVDVTTDYLIPEDQQGEGRFMAKADGVVCGTQVATVTISCAFPVKQQHCSRVSAPR